MKLSTDPEQPLMSEWKFVEHLKRPLHEYISLERSMPKENEADLSKGVSLKLSFPDKEKLLETAHNDFKSFLDKAKISTDGSYQIITERSKTECFEAYRINISKDSCRIQANDTEGIRRALIYLEDEILRAGGPFIPAGLTEKKPLIKTRISRCFFGPIKRPPLNRDELMDDVDYYPDEYLNKLAHEGINGLWLTITFKDLCKTSIAPEYGKDAGKRLLKLRRTVDKCRRYGIKIYIFCIEPAAWKIDDPPLLRHPELGGARNGDTVFFCPFSETSQKYLYDSVYGIFKAVPNLGGMINISYGERATTCFSSIQPSETKPVDCPVCSGKKNWEILESSLSAMEKGMRNANPDARLISWLYTPQTGDFADWFYEIPNHTPKNVTLQLNFESGGVKDQLGKPRSAGDYWLSYVGPSSRFKSIAKNAFPAKTEMSAKLQVGCSHEIATVPFVPVPSLLYKKYKEMRKLDVSSVMQCWYFGNCPGLMNKAAGDLAFENFADSEKDFLLRLALPDWGSSANKVVKAWGLFADGYSNYPVSNMFQYYGPMHDGIVWPLYLFPDNETLAPTWQICFGTSGDIIGECLGNHTLDEAIGLCREMSKKWSSGVEIMKKLRKHFQANPERLKDIGVAEVIGLQFESGYNILRFYALREELFDSQDKSKYYNVLDQMESIVLDEIKRSSRMIELCEYDSRLGFHSEAEGYKYFPEKLKWRIKMLQKLQSEDFSRARASSSLYQNTEDALTYNCNCDSFEDCDSFKWKASHDTQDLTIEISCDGKGDPDQFFISLMFRHTSVLIIDLYKSGYVRFSKNGCSRQITETASGWKVSVKMPIEHDIKTARLSIIRIKTDGEKSQIDTWGGSPQKYRLRLGMYNPKKMGLLILCQ